MIWCHASGLAGVTYPNTHQVEVLGWPLLGGSPEGHRRGLGTDFRGSGEPVRLQGGLASSRCSALTASPPGRPSVGGLGGYG